MDIWSTPPEESVVQPQALQWPSDKLIVKNPVKNKNGQTVPVYWNPSIKNVTVDGKEDNDGGYLYFSDNSDSDLSHDAFSVDVTYDYDGKKVGTLTIDFPHGFVLHWRSDTSNSYYCVDEDTTYCPGDLMLTNSPGFYTKMT